MSRRLCLAFASLVLALGACDHEPTPPNVPGPTVARPEPVARPAEIAPADKKLIGLRAPDANVVSLRIVFAAGSADDPTGKEGITALTATEMAEGGTKDLPYATLLERLFPSASTIELSVDRDETAFSVDVPRAALPEVWPLVRDVIAAPRLDGEAFSRVKAKQTSTIVDDLRGGNDEELGKEALHAALYEGHPYGHPVEGTERGLAAISEADVRAHRARTFCRERMTLGIAGGYPDGFDRAAVRELLAALPACDAARAELPKMTRHQGMRVLIVDKPSADSTAISLGFPTDLTRASPDFPAIVFFTDYLGLHRQSAGRLYHELRELRGLNYGDYAYAEHFEQAGWGRNPRPNVVRRSQMVSLWLRPVKPKNGIFALRGALDIYRDLLTRGIDDAEIERFRGFLGRYVGLEQQTASRRLGYALDDLAYGLGASYLDTMRGGWAHLDSAKLAAATRRWLTADDLTVAIVAKDGQALARALVKGDPSPPVYDAPKPKEVTDADQAIQKLPLGLRAEDVRVVPVGEMFK